MSTIRRCPLCRVCNFFQRKVIIDKNCTIFYVNCDEEKDNEYHKHVIAVIYDSFHSKEIVGYVPLYWNELADKFLKVSNYHICVVVIGKRVNRGIGLGLEIPVGCFFHGNN